VAHHGGEQLTRVSQGPDDDSTQDSVPQSIAFNRDQVADLADRLEVLLADPAADLSPDERQEWENVRATAERLANEFEPPK